MPMILAKIYPPGITLRCTSVTWDVTEEKSDCSMWLAISAGWKSGSMST
jgi:hypothetical protein